ncbi:MAG: 30S ribosomal protein S20 [Oscillospiraceae bacterium]|jgi:small subunit ribosomal protein S20|nr:30S ribosomal protein S20 [Oscillospiraceae bacterium]
MPNIKSAKKRVKIISVKTLRNKALNSALKKKIKKAKTALNISSNESKNFVMEAVSSIDKAASKGVIHKNAAARKKSKLICKLSCLAQK